MVSTRRRIQLSDLTLMWSKCIIILFLLFVALYSTVAFSEEISCISEYTHSYTLMESEKDPALLQQIQQDASQGNDVAAFCLGQLYLLGWGVDADDTKAWKLFHQAAQKGNSKAMHRIAVMYELGVHVQQNYQKALHWHLQSAKLGYSSAQSDVGIFYEDGLAGDRDIAMALFWYRKAAIQDEPFAVEALHRLKQEQ